jgi:hypothetical protein
MDEKQKVRHQPAPRQHLSREEVGTRQNTHVGTDEVRPRRTLPAFGCPSGGSINCGILHGQLTSGLSQRER